MNWHIDKPGMDCQGFWIFAFQQSRDWMQVWQDQDVGAETGPSATSRMSFRISFLVHLSTSLYGPSLLQVKFLSSWDDWDKWYYIINNLICFMYIHVGFSLEKFQHSSQNSCWNLLWRDHYLLTQLTQLRTTTKTSVPWTFVIWPRTTWIIGMQISPGC